MTIQFIGATESVTGSKHIITTNTGKKILLDCGMFQGEYDDSHSNNLQFGFNPEEIHSIILSHAHIDHSGLIPKLVKDGFRGVIFATPATIALCEVMLLDSAHIQESDTIHINRRRLEEGKKPIDPIYTVKEVQMSFSMFKSVEYNVKTEIDEDLSFFFTDAGHILGSAAVHIDYFGKNQSVKFTFTGDIGRPYDKILPPPSPFRQADYILSESTYGDRLHDDNSKGIEKLYEIVRDTCILKRGKVIIPAFSLDRTQELVYALDVLKGEGKLPSIKVFVDSPLSVKTTHIMQEFNHLFNEEIRTYMKSTDGYPFVFKDIEYISDVEKSKALNYFKEPCIIISASGMAEAGRIKHHIKNNITDPNNTILLAGYSSPGSLAGRLKRGDTEVKIYGKMYNVMASVQTMDNYSAHADYKEMLQYFKCQDPSKVKKIFLVHGLDEAKINFKKLLNESGFKDVVIPQYKDFFVFE